MSWSISSVEALGDKIESYKESGVADRCHIRVSCPTSIIDEVRGRLQGFASVRTRVRKDEKTLESVERKRHVAQSFRPDKLIRYQVAQDNKDLSMKDLIQVGDEILERVE